jgi:drug/metabolite transporter (DMT)-like permease
MAAIIVAALEHTSALSLLFWSYVFAVPFIALVHFFARGGSVRDLWVPPRVLAIGLLGIFVWPAGLFLGLDRAPVVQANLINYLWPVLIVALAPLALERFSPRYTVAVAVSLAGVALLVTGGRDLDIETRDATGYAAAFAAAVGWALYSVLSKRYRVETRGHVLVFAAWSALLVAGLAAVTGEIDEPSTGTLAAAAALGIGPLGIAFLFWERAQSQADVARLGAFSYIDPLASTLILALAVDVDFGAAELGGLLLVTGGIVVAEWPALTSPESTQEGTAGRIRDA